METKKISIMENTNPKTTLQIMLAIAVTSFLLSFVLLFGSCTNSKLYAGNYSKYNHFRNKGAIVKLADSLYKAGDSSCFVMQKDGRWCLNCKDSLKFSK